MPGEKERAEETSLNSLNGGLVCISAMQALACYTPALGTRKCEQFSGHCLRRRSQPLSFP